MREDATFTTLGAARSAMSAMEVVVPAVSVRAKAGWGRNVLATVEPMSDLTLAGDVAPAAGAAEGADG